MKNEIFPANRLSVPHIILREMTRPGGVVVALAVGTILTFTKQFHALSSVLPFIVPYLVGLLTRVTARLSSRRREMLLSLPAFRKDPAFIIDRAGKITASTGETARLFSDHGITGINQFLDGYDGGSETPLFSPITKKWYSLQLRKDATHGNCLVWLDDVTTRVRLEERQDALRGFTRKLQEELLTNESFSDGDRRLADLLLGEGYEVILLARLDGVVGALDDQSASGTLYGTDDREPRRIRFPVDTDAPIMRSRREGRAIWDSRDSFSSEHEFLLRYPVIPEVRDYIDAPIRNLANYHSGDVSIIAFNKTGRLQTADIAVLESVADTAVTAFSLLDLAHRADRRFIQSIHGVCAAAEYSDELTGGHIWRVNDYARHLAGTIGLSPRVREEIGTVAAMHDIGKVAIPHIIKLPRALTDTERREMKLHTVYGAQIIDRMRHATGEVDHRLNLACRIALHHHQEWDGSGYPGLITGDGRMVDTGGTDVSVYFTLRSLRESEIPQEALIVSLADKYDALRSCRQYKPGFSHEKTLSILMRDDRTGRHGRDVFGPDVFSAFMDTHEEFGEIFATERREASCDVPESAITEETKR